VDATASKRGSTSSLYLPSAENPKNPAPKWGKKKKKEKRSPTNWSWARIKRGVGVATPGDPTSTAYGA